MGKIRVSIVDQTTLKLEQDGVVGDIIDLKELQTVDNSSILDAIKNAKDEVYKEMLAKEIESQKAQNKIDMIESEKAFNQKYNDLKLEKEKMQHIVDSFDEKMKSEKLNAEIKLQSDFDLQKTALESKIKELTNSIESDKRSAILETEKKKDEEILKKEEALKILINQKDMEVQSLNSQIKSMKEQEMLLIENEKNALRRQLELGIFEKDKEINELRKQITENEFSKKDDLSKKEIEILNLSSKLSNLELVKKAEYDNALSELKAIHFTEISLKDTEINQLRLTKSNLNVKTLGEGLERWCYSEYEAYSLSGFDNCSLHKDNKVVKDAPLEKGTKADYIFEVYLDANKNEADKLISVCCEMKSESPDSKNKTKNSDHYKKLDADRLKKNCQYALLVSELEWDTTNDVPIKKISEYENMYMVRPTYFISFLSLVKSLTTKYQSLLLAHKIENENLKDTQEIIDDFESFKKTYLDKPLNSLLKDVEEIKKEAKKAYDSSHKIIGLSDTIISSKIEEMKMKIERFDIKKTTRKIDKLNNS